MDIEIYNWRQAMLTDVEDGIDDHFTIKRNYGVNDDMFNYHLARARKERYGA
jgi:hypothetical protein